MLNNTTRYFHRPTTGNFARREKMLLLDCLAKQGGDDENLDSGPLFDFLPSTYISTLC